MNGAAAADQRTMGLRANQAVDAGISPCISMGLRNSKSRAPKACRSPVGRRSRYAV